MLLPQRLSGLEKYLAELPKNLEITYDILNEYPGMVFNNDIIRGGYSNSLTSYDKGVSTFEDTLDFTIYEKVLGKRIHFTASYNPKKRNAEVWAITLDDEEGEMILERVREDHCLIAESIARQEDLDKASEFLNIILEKYSLHIACLEFEKLREEEKIKNQNSLPKKTLDARLIRNF